MVPSELPLGELQSQAFGNDVATNDESIYNEDDTVLDHYQRLVQEDFEVSIGQGAVQPSIHFHLYISHTLSTFN